MSMGNGGFEKLVPEKRVRDMNSESIVQFQKKCKEEEWRFKEETEELKKINTEHYPDLIFKVGEKVKVKGGDFRIKSIGSKMMVLEGLPGTRIALDKWEKK